MRKFWTSASSLISTLLSPGDLLPLRYPALFTSANRFSQHPAAQQNPHANPPLEEAVREHQNQRPPSYRTYAPQGDQGETPSFRQTNRTSPPWHDKKTPPSHQTQTTSPFHQENPTNSPPPHHPPHLLEDEEVSKFSKHSNRWWDPSGPFSILHAYNPFRIEFIREQFVATQRGSFPHSSSSLYTFFSNNFSRFEYNPQFLQNQMVLDVGCGGGILSEALAEAGGKVVGIDLSQAGIAAANNRVVSGATKFEVTQRLMYVHSSIENFVENEGGRGKFDLVVASEVLEHIEDQGAFVSFLSEAVREGGTLVITTLNRTMESYLLGILVAEQLLGVIPNGTHDWNKFVVPEELHTHARLHRLHHLSTKGFIYLPMLNTFCPDPLSRTLYMSAFRKLPRAPSHA